MAEVSGETQHQPVCPYCVQWRCSRHHDDNCHDPECWAGGYEPYWANGQAAVITQQEPCSECGPSLALMYASRTTP